MSTLKSSAPHLPLEDCGLPQSKAARGARKPRWALFLLVPVLMVALLTGAIIGMYFQPPGVRAFFNITSLQPGGGTDTPIAVAVQQVSDLEQVAVVSEGDVVALGRVIPFGDIVSVATPSGAGDARIAQLRVGVGDVVAAGDILAVLDNLPRLQSTVATAQAKVEVLEATLARTRLSNAASQAESQAALESAEAAAAVAQADLVRTTSLFERGVTTRAQLDAAVAIATETARRVEGARATLSRFAEGSPTVQADIAVAEGNLASARAELAAATQNLSSAYVRAPERGTVLNLSVRAGERPPNDGIIHLGDTSRMTVEAEVYQTMIGRVTIGDPVRVSAEALPQDLDGIVSAIGIEIGRQSITSEDPASNTDARVVDVIVELDAASSGLAQNLTNLEVVVRIDAGRSE